MKVLYTILFIILDMISYAQDFVFAEDGKMENGYAHLDTIMNLNSKFKTGRAFIFKKIDQGRNYIINDKDTIFMNFKGNSKDSFERFCLINTGKTVIRLDKQDWSLISVKEVQTYDGKWRPIEFWNYSWCGNSYYEYSILPGQCLLLTTYKQYGEIKAKLRLRLRTKTNGVIVSDPYLAFLDKSYLAINSKFKSLGYALKQNATFLQ